MTCWPALHHPSGLPTHPSHCRLLLSPRDTNCSLLHPLPYPTHPHLELLLQPSRQLWRGLAHGGAGQRGHHHRLRGRRRHHHRIWQVAHVRHSGDPHRIAAPGAEPLDLHERGGAAVLPAPAVGAQHAGQIVHLAGRGGRQEAGRRAMGAGKAGEWRETKAAPEGRLPCYLPLTARAETCEKPP